ncbi:MAG TPA: beta-propeller domain-containing protein, partial [Candidatus Bathyarchaeia archaeon]|nr:beta-propeller domain-containing protein [Candidatus Bathyarchaeia archaeon]
AVVLAYPTSNAQLVAKIAVNGTIQGIFIDGTKLAVVSENYAFYPYPVPYMITSQSAAMGIAYPFYFNRQTTSVWIFDLSNHSNPVMTTTLVANGTLAGARLIGNEMYTIATLPIYCSAPAPIPESIINGRAILMGPSQIYHSDIADYAQSFTTVIGIDISQQNPIPTAKSFLIGTSSNIYVSTNNIYLTQPIWGLTEQTVIHRISIDGSNISYEATGTVTGHVLNQFSMDEYNGYFRIATTDYAFTPQPLSGAPIYTSSTQETNVFVMDSSLHLTGALAGLSPGESFYAARFMGDRAYLVTYQRMDPLFVIGLNNPTSPQVLGQLNITGVSDYLQPYDDTHLIGLGKSSTNVTWENAALFQGLKFSFFDVSDPNHPIDTSNFLAGDRGSDSPALTDHKAVLFDQSLNLLVVPVEIAHAQANTTYPWAYNPPVWQGAYVFSVSIQNGIVFRGGITQLPSGQLPSYQNSNLFINRSLYIGSVLYTVSNGMVMMNSLADLSQLGSVSLA